MSKILFKATNTVKENNYTTPKLFNIIIACYSGSLGRTKRDNGISYMHKSLTHLTHVLHFVILVLFIL